MNEHIFDSLVTDYEDLIGTLDLPDTGDNHVLAAAVRCQANVIVTRVRMQRPYYADSVRHATSIAFHAYPIL